MKKKAVSYTKSVVIGAVVCVLILIYETKKISVVIKSHKYIGKNDVKKKVKKKLVDEKEKKKEKMMRDDEARRCLRFAPDRLRSCRRPPFRETSACPRR